MPCLHIYCLSCYKVLPSQVVRELDGLKKGISDTARAARRVITFLRDAQRSKVGWLVGAPDLPMLPELTVGSGMTADRVILVSAVHVQGCASEGEAQLPSVRASSEIVVPQRLLPQPPLPPTLLPLF